MKEYITHEIVITKEKSIEGLKELEANIIGGLQNELRNSIKKFGKIVNM